MQPGRSLLRLAVVAATAFGLAACSLGTPVSAPPDGSPPSNGTATTAPGTAVPATVASGTAATATPDAFPSLDTGPTMRGLIVFVWRNPGHGNGLATIHPDGTGRALIPDTSDATEPAL